MEEKETFKQIDADILQGRADIFRAQQEGLGAKAPGSEKPLPAALRPLRQIRVGEAESTSLPEQEETAVSSEQENLVELSRQVREELARTADEEENESKSGEIEKDIPRFDLAEQILVEQRRAVAQRRQKSGAGDGIGPALNDRGIHQVVRAINQPPSVQTNMDRPKMASPVSLRNAAWPEEAGFDEGIIARIVASDIARLCRRA
ncbi:MAG: hypothetical protein JW828_09170 [Sedimentisphaerales bacterium]|nr:hypothetical protein [Sedimentisphaerales bacterium]